MFFALGKGYGCLFRGRDNSRGNMSRFCWAFINRKIKEKEMFMKHLRNTRRGFTQQSCLPKGFTLIELLIGVLIVGILVAIALPQYQAAVLRTQMTQAFVTGKAYLEAQNVYYLEHGTFANGLNQLNVQIKIPTGWTGVIGNNRALFLSHTASEIYFNFFPAHTSYYEKNTAYCFVSYTSKRLSLAKQTCQNLTGKTPTTDDSNNRFMYLFRW